MQKDGQVDALMGYFTRNGVMTSPLFGYDTEKPQSTGLYRMIATLLALEAKDKQHLLNHSAGAGSFKKLRRAEEVIEYMAVYNKHLSFFRRIPWAILRRTMNSIGVPFMKHYQL